jgi:hypothetical protein
MMHGGTRWFQYLCGPDKLVMSSKDSGMNNLVLREGQRNRRAGRDGWYKEGGSSAYDIGLHHKLDYHQDKRPAINPNKIKTPNQNIHSQ